MKILWFTNTPSNYSLDSSGYGEGGWISSLETEMRKHKEIQLAVAFFHRDTCFKKSCEGVVYYPMHKASSLISKTDRFFRISAQDEKEISLCMKVIEDFKPDVIHIFGTESCFGLLCKRTNIPTVLHLQGLMAPCINAWVPPFYSLTDYFFAEGFSPSRVVLRIRGWAFNRHAAEREKEIMRSCRNFIGRTDWDKSYVSISAPHARYFHCDEILRPAFYVPGTRKKASRPTFVSTLSSPLYKGHDMVLKTAKIFKDTCVSDFEWHIYGISSIRLAEKKTGIRATDVNVVCKGTASAEKLREALLSCDAYIHPSYIDNSPNSLCEAQILGVPVLATHVGGVGTMMGEDAIDSIVPANDPYQMCFKMVQIIHDGNTQGFRARKFVHGNIEGENPGVLRCFE